MFRSELAKMIEKLEGYDDDWYEVLEAKRDGDCWVLTVKHRKEQKKAEAKNEDNK